MGAGQRIGRRFMAHPFAVVFGILNSPTNAPAAGLTTLIVIGFV